MGEGILEVKRHLDGRQQVFACQALVVTPQRAVIRFVNPQPIGSAPSASSGQALPAGSVTIGFFWRRRHYNLYRFLAPDGRLLGHRFDVITDVRIGHGRIEYLDLLLDVRVDVHGNLRVEDDDEVATYAAQGLLSPQQLAIIDRTRRHITAHHQEIIQRAVAGLPGQSPVFPYPPLL